MKKIIGILIIVLIIICIILGIAIINLNDNENNNINIGETQNKVENTTIIENSHKDFFEDYDIRLVQSKSDYKTVQKVIDKYFLYCSYLNNKRQEGINAIKSILSKEYMEEYNYNDEKIYSSFISHANDNIIIDKVYEKDVNVKTIAYIVHGYLKNNQTDISMLILTDRENNTFSILPKEYIEKYNYDESHVENIRKLLVQDIEKNDYNTYEYSVVAQEEYSKKLLYDYIDKALYYPNLAYNYLNEDYKNNKFNTVEKYKEYIQNNKDILMLYDAKNIKAENEFDNNEQWNLYFNTVKLLEIDKYLITERDGYTEYAIIDTYGNYYIFQETSPMQYTVMLDTYTIDLPEFLEKYNEGNEEKKVEMNIGRFFDAIQANDYEYAYSKLDETYRANYFSNLAQFETFAKNNFIYDEITYNEFSNLNDIYTYSIELENQGIGKNIIFAVTLLEGTNFTISFQG